jgi:hypothetical protein
MTASLPELLQALRRTLQDAVRPHVDDDHAAGQLAGVVDILGKLERMTVWSPQADAEQAQVLNEGCDAFATRAAKEGLDVADDTAGVHPRDDLQAAQARIVRLTDALFDAPAALSDTARGELDALLQTALKQQLTLQRKRIPLTDFSAMTAGASKD